MKKLLSLALVLAMSLALLTACGQAATPPSSEDADSGSAKIEVSAVAFYTSNLGSQSFADVVDRGLKQAAADFGIKYSALESVDPATIVDTARSAIAQGANLLVFTANQYAEGIEQLLDEYPDVMFCLPDGAGTIPQPYMPNYHEVTYKEHEAAFLTGAFAAMMSKTGKVAQLQGQEGGTLARFNAGFRCGVKYVNGTDPTTVVIGFTDVNKGYETTMMLYDQGYDWVACCAGGSNLGVFQASEEKGGDYWTLGAADGQFHLMPSRIVASQVKTIDKVVHSIVEQVVAGNFPGGTGIQMGIKEGGVDLIFTDKNADLVAMVPKDVKDKLDQLRADIISGKLVVPSDPAAVAGFSEKMAS